MTEREISQPESVNVEYGELFPESYRGVIIVDPNGTILHRIFQAGGVRDIELAEVWMMEHAQSPWFHSGDCDNFVEDVATDQAKLQAARADARKNLGPMHIVLPVAPPGQPYAGFEVRR